MVIEGTEVAESQNHCCDHDGHDDDDDDDDDDDVDGGYDDSDVHCSSPFRCRRFLDLIGSHDGSVVVVSGNDNSDLAVDLIFYYVYKIFVIAEIVGIDWQYPSP